MIDKDKWIDAINLNQIDGNEASEYLQDLIKENIDGKIDKEEIITKVKDYYGRN